MSFGRRFVDPVRRRHAYDVFELFPGGVAVAVPTSLLTDKGGRLRAVSLSPLDMMAMAKTQTGHTVAINMDRRHMILRTSRG